MHISSGAPDAPLHHEPWNKGKLVGPKPPLTLQQVWEIRIRLQILNRTRDLVLFNLAIDGKLRSCDLVRLRVADITQYPLPTPCRDKIRHPDSIKKQ